ncbi:hypothetical protein LQF12_14660 [Ruania suaedae]|uniref:hypothetical protein n=1 Tax=Ruania suaedae TaxID=2897774 RepID=UPI001E305850|nr:hypothetical protein [Ruania suaedae]UFU02710.1 hypothetical protein LQF12_14660 [Ruania suaedae]
MRLDGLLDGLARVVETMWLSALWMISALPVITAPAGTSALVEVARMRQDGELHGSVSRAFVRCGLARIRTSTVVLGLWLLAVAVLAVNFSVVSQLGAARVPILLGLLGVAVALALFGAVLPAAVATVGAREPEGHASVVRLRLTVRTAAAAVAASPLSAANVVLAGVVGTVLVLAVPVTILLVPGVLAHVSAMGWRRCTERMAVLLWRRTTHIPA